jgi:membrane protein
MSTVTARPRASTTSPATSDVESPTDLPRASWRGILRRTVGEFREDNATDWAAALTYYGILSLFPALLVLVSLVGLAGPSTTDAVIENVNAVTPGPARDIVTSAVQNLQDNGGTALGVFILGLLGALWSASGYVGAFSRAANAIWEVEEGRPFYKLRPQQLAVTALMLVLLTASAIAVVVTGGIADQVGQVVGVGDTAVSVWDIAKWPFLVVIVSIMLAILYWAAPNAQQPGIRWVSPGGILAVIVWIIASAGFAFYVANFSSYNKTYGALGGAVAFLVWLWISNLAVLLGAEFNAETTRARQMRLGQPEDHEPITPPRDTTKFKRDATDAETATETETDDATHERVAAAPVPTPAPRPTPVAVAAPPALPVPTVVRPAPGASAARSAGRAALGGVAAGGHAGRWGARR